MHPTEIVNVNQASWLSDCIHNGATSLVFSTAALPPKKPSTNCTDQKSPVSICNGELSVISPSSNPSV